MYFIYLFAVGVNEIASPSQQICERQTDRVGFFFLFLFLVFFFFLVVLFCANKFVMIVWFLCSTDN